MLTRRFSSALIGLAFLPAVAGAEPISIGLHSLEGGATASLSSSLLTSPFRLGEITLPDAYSAVLISVSGLAANTNYLMEVLVHGATSAWNTLRAEVLDPLDDDDALDLAPYHAGVPDGFSTSNTRDGFSFAQSAGLEPGGLNPLAVSVMAEEGIDISGKKTQEVFDVWKSGRNLFTHVITVCDEASAERCPIFPGPAKRLHWSFPDPSTVTGTHEEKLAVVRKIRDEIRMKIETWCDEVCVAAATPH